MDSFYVEEPVNEFQVNTSSAYQMTIKLIQRDGNTPDFLYDYAFVNSVPNLAIGVLAAEPCSLTVTSATASGCNPASNTYSLQVVVAYSSPPAGNLTVTTSSGASVTVAQTASPQTILLPALPSNGATAINVTATFADAPACSHTRPAAYAAPASCSAGCNKCLQIQVIRQ